MERKTKGKALDIVLAACGIFFLAMGLMDLGTDLFGTLLGLGAGLPLLLVFLWRMIRESRGKSVAIRLGDILLFCLAMFFLTLGIAGIASNRQSVILGLSVGIPVGALYLWRRIREYREADAEEEAEEKPAAPVRVKAEPPMTVCPHCGAPAQAEVCPYCGLSKKP